MRQNIAFGLKRGWWNPSKHVAHADVDYWLKALESDPGRTAISGAIIEWAKATSCVGARWFRIRNCCCSTSLFQHSTWPCAKRIRQELADLQSRLDIPMVLITRDPDDVAMFGDQVVSLREGIVQPDDALDALSSSRQESRSTP